MEKLIIDLRGNGGGYLNAAIDIADEFLEKKQLIVYTEGLNRPKSYEYARSGGALKNVPFVILRTNGRLRQVKFWQGLYKITTWG